MYEENIVCLYGPTSKYLVKRMRFISKNHMINLLKVWNYGAWVYGPTTQTPDDPNKIDDHTDERVDLA